eukprot:15474115-Alexandrium_andersonii.AAC.1
MTAPKSTHEARGAFCSVILRVDAPWATSGRRCRGKGIGLSGQSLARRPLCEPMRGNESSVRRC